jgi:hypothetical protein
MNGTRIEQLLEEANALKRDALALQHEAVSMQREALAAQREIVAQTRANLDLAKGVNERAAELQRRARRVLALILPLVLLLIGYVSWLLFFRLRY